MAPLQMPEYERELCHRIYLRYLSIQKQHIHKYLDDVPLRSPRMTAYAKYAKALEFRLNNAIFASNFMVELAWSQAVAYTASDKNNELHFKSLVADEPDKLMALLVPCISEEAITKFFEPLSSAVCIHSILNNPENKLLAEYCKMLFVLTLQAIITTSSGWKLVHTDPTPFISMTAVHAAVALTPNVPYYKDLVEPPMIPKPGDVWSDEAAIFRELEEQMAKGPELDILGEGGTKRSAPDGDEGNAGMVDGVAKRARLTDFNAEFNGIIKVDDDFFDLNVDNINFNGTIEVYDDFSDFGIYSTDFNVNLDFKS